MLPARLACAATLTTIALATLNGSAAADSTFALGSPSAGTATATVSLDAGGAHGRTGILALVVKNASGADATPVVRFLPQSGGPGIRVAVPRTPAAAARARVAFTANGAPARLPAHAVGQITLRFRLLPGARLSTVSGQLLIGDVGATPDPLVVPVEARSAAPPDITPAPGAVTLQLTQWLPFAAPSGGEALVQLDGARAGSVYARPHQLDGRAILRNAGGDEAHVRWRVDASGRTVAVSVQGSPAPGKYSGTLPLSTAAENPDVAVTVKARAGALAPLAAVLLGAALSLVLTILGPLRRRKRLLRVELLAALQEYRERRREYEHVASYSLDEVIGPDPHPWTSRAWMALPKRKGLEGLFSSIYWARSTQDLDEDADWALDFAADVSRWELVEGAAQHLLAVARTPGPPDRETRSFAGTQTAIDTQELLSLARIKPPKEDAEAEDLSHRLELQADWQSRVADAWRTAVEQYRGGHGNALRGEQIGALLDQLTSATPPMSSRTAEQQAALLAELERLDALLHAAAGEQAAPGTALVPSSNPSLLGGRIVAPAAQTHAMQQRNAVAQAAAPAPGGGLEGAARRTGSGRTRRGIGRTRTAAAADRQMQARIRAMLASQTWEDVVITAAIALVTAIVYLPTLYDDTWGSLSDVLTAVGAGFGARAIIQWAVMPAFQSRRLRRSTPQDQGAIVIAGTPANNGSAPIALLPPPG